MPGIVWWTSGRLARLADLAARGMTAREIARRLSGRRRISVNAVRDRARRAGIPLLARGGRPFGTHIERG